MALLRCGRRRLAGLVQLCATIVLPATVTAQTNTASVATSSVTSDARDAEFFGESDGRDSDIFGGAEPAQPQGQVETPVGFPPEGEELDRSLTGDSSGRMFATLVDTNDRLQIGGRTYLRLDYSAAQEVAAEENRVSSPNLVDLYFDARPNDRLRAYARGRLRYNPTLTEGEISTNPFAPSGSPVSVSLDQLYAKFDVEQKLFVTVGKQSVKWGTGRFWNPTDFLNRQRLSPLEVFDERLGVGLVKLHVPFESLGWNLYAIASMDGASSAEEIGGAARAEILLDQTEVSLSAAARKDQPTILGLDISSGVWLFDLRAELALTHGVKTSFWEGEFSIAPVIESFDDLKTPKRVDRSDEWIPQLVLGAEVSIKYSDEDNLTIGAEYFYNGAGYDDESQYPWLVARNAGCGVLAETASSTTAKSLSQQLSCEGSASDSIPFLYLGKHYAAAYLLLMAPGSWNDTTVIASALANLSDLSMLMRLDWRVSLLTYLQANFYLSGHLGTHGGEFRFGSSIPLRGLTTIPGITLDPAFAGLAQAGIQWPAPLFEAGLGMTLNF